MTEKTRPKIGVIPWADLTVADASDIREFYRRVVGWNSTEIDMGGYSDYCMNDPLDGQAVAGICHARGVNEGLPALWLLYIVVENADSAAAACVEAGGQVIRPPAGAGPNGRYCVIRDPAGAVAALYEPAG